MSSDKGDVQQTQGMADVTVVAGGDPRRRICRKPVGGMVVGNDHHVAVAVVSAEVSPVERTAAYEDREQHGNAAEKQIITAGVPPHPYGLYRPIGPVVNARSG